MRAPVPLNELFGGIIAILVVGGTVAMAIIGRTVPSALVGLDGAVCIYYFSAQSFNAGVDHGMKVRAADEK